MRDDQVGWINVWKTRLRRHRHPWALRWRKADGALTQITIGPMSERDAERVRFANLLRVNGLAEASLPPAADWQTFVTGYLEAMGVELAPASVREARAALRRFGEMISPRMAVDVTIETAERFKARRLGVVASATVRKELRTLRAAFAWAVRCRIVPENPFGNVQVARRREAPLPQVLSSDETGRFLAGLKTRSTWAQAALRLAVRWGVRAGELAKIERGDVDFRGRVVHIRVKRDWAPKAGRGRAVPLDEETAGLLQELSHRSIPILWGPLDQPFTSGEARGGFVRALRVEARAVYATIGLGRAVAKPLHILRATALTRMRQAGVPPWIIRQIIGHTSDAVGDAHYDGTSLEEACRLAEERLKTRAVT